MSEEEFLGQHAGLVYNLALRLTGNRSDAEDLAQDALLRALKALPGFRGDSQLSTWTYRITVNAWKNRVRAEKSRGFWKTISFGALGGDEDDEDSRFEPPAADPPLDVDLEKEEDGAVVQKALMQLDPSDRAIVVLREIDERSYEDIGAVMGLPQGTVKSRLFRARAKLKFLLGKARS
ncbi:MAG: sigma-70 family RNA polymerase sigma factor [Elusimicrobia bacterium]|nr:sigma-70 family RNA polymerase sigma factor [Elusimicrobiota bacterium]